MDYDRLRELQEKFEENPRRYFAPLANEYRKGGQPRRAIEICRAQLAQMPGHMSGQIVFGQALYEAGEFDEARQVFERALTLDPENLIALRTLGDMSLQSGDTVQARSWYMRLLDADPKDTAVVTLVAEIDASAEAVTPTAEVIPGVDTDAGDQPIPFIADAEGNAIGAESHTAAASEAATPEPVAQEPGAPEPAALEAPTPVSAIEGLERHYPVESESAPAASAEPGAETPADRSELSAEELGVGLGAEGLKSSIPTPATGLEGVHSVVEPATAGAEGLSGGAPEPEPAGAEGLKGKPVESPLAGTRGSRSDDEDALDTWTPPPGAHVHERVESRKEDRMFSGPSPEPFVNETMAQLYLQQGFRQLALKVYYQLSASRPNDQGLKDKIAEIEAADRAAHPGEPAVPPTPAPRSPSIEAPTPSRGSESEEAPGYDRTPIDSPPGAPPSRHRESIESPAREEPRAEPEGIAARQPSIKEFFATLGRRRPARAGATTSGRGGNSANYGSSSAMNAAPSSAEVPPMSASPSAPADMGGAAAGASLDAVFAGAQVNPADSRAAARLAGAFSGTPGARTTPPTPPMPTPRVNPRLPQAQESEEDVAKFRAWLDGLTGE
ncbi:MAG: tetratricopeptide repeat protein [Gemmatimonadaceae bacterium]